MVMKVNVWTDQKRKKESERIIKANGGSQNGRPQQAKNLIQTLWSMTKSN